MRQPVPRHNAMAVGNKKQQIATGTTPKPQSLYLFVVTCMWGEATALDPGNNLPPAHPKEPRNNKLAPNK